MDAEPLFYKWNEYQLLQSLVQHVVHFVVLQLLLELVGLGVLVDLNVLDAKHLGKVFPVLFGNVVREG